VNTKILEELCPDVCPCRFPRQERREPRSFKNFFLIKI